MLMSRFIGGHRYIALIDAFNIGGPADSPCGGSAATVRGGDFGGRCPGGKCFTFLSDAGCDGGGNRFAITVSVTKIMTS